MKNLLLVVLLIPMFSMAQENFLGRSQPDIRVIFKNSSNKPSQKNTLFGVKYSDAFDTGNNEEIICGYDKKKICVEVLKIMNMSRSDSTRATFNNKYVKLDGEIFSDDVWADKEKTFKVHLYGNFGRLILDYVPYNKPYVIY